MSDHKGNAQNWLEMADHHSDWAGEAPKQTVERYLAAAQAEATLYLAEQQRIANLIEISRGRREEIQQLVSGELAGVSDGADGSLADAVPLEQLVREGCAINAQIREGLGLR